MKRLRIILFTVMYGFVCHYFIVQSAVYAQENLAASVDCADIRVNYVDDPTLTREERIRLMDKAYYKSLNKFDCVNRLRKWLELLMVAQRLRVLMVLTAAPIILVTHLSKKKVHLQVGSVASSMMSGTELPNVGSAAEDNSKVEKSDVSSALRSAKNENNMNKRNISAGNGKLPDDIPSADNDGALAAQIRYAAENETDPVKKVQLWNEYRKYKGLPQK